MLGSQCVFFTVKRNLLLLDGYFLLCLFLSDLFYRDVDLLIGNELGFQLVFEFGFAFATVLLRDATISAFIEYPLLKLFACAPYALAVNISVAENRGVSDVVAAAKSLVGNRYDPFRSEVLLYLRKHGHKCLRIMRIPGEQSVRYGQPLSVEQQTHLHYRVFSVFLRTSFPPQIILSVDFEVIVCDVIVNKLRFAPVFFRDLFVKMPLQRTSDFVEVCERVIDIVERKCEAV